jgi:ABC-type dipeptide/oligopeptide/nickel transport system permease component
MGNKKYHFEEFFGLILLMGLSMVTIFSKIYTKNKFIHNFSLFYLNLLLFIDGFFTIEKIFSLFY